MGIRSKWRAGHMKDPVSGVFKVADWYDAHPHSSPPGTRLTGVVVADGIAPTPAEVPADHHGKWVGQNELPVTVDRSNPTNFRVEWDQIVKNDWQSTARQRANEAAARLAAGDQPAGGFGGAQGFSITTGDGVAPMIDQALRSAGVDPIVLRGSHSTVSIQTSFGNTTSGSSMGGFGAAMGGTPATGVVTAVHDVAPPMPLPGGMSQADLTLDVQRPDGSTYPVTTRIGFRTPARRAAIATIGTRLPVLVDPSDPGRVTIDVAKLNLP
ncbi:MAG TPA: hypothetical protein VGL80_21860 [Pseudonocardiaceae bacterium]